MVILIGICCLFSDELLLCGFLVDLIGDCWCFVSLDYWVLLYVVVIGFVECCLGSWLGLFCGGVNEMQCVLRAIFESVCK